MASKSEARKAVEDFRSGRLTRRDITCRETELTASLDELSKSIRDKKQQIENLQEKHDYEYKLLRIYRAMLELMGDMDD